jgi:hypothetical protein
LKFDRSASKFVDVGGGVEALTGKAGAGERLRQSPLVFRG